ERLQQAAEDLVHYLGRRIGVPPALARDGKAVAGPAIYVGRCEATLETDLPDPKLGPECYAVRQREGSLYLLGRYSTPSAFAVYDFLQRELGIRWYAPGELWEYVPAPAPGLTCEVTERVVVPDTSPRVWSGHQWTPSWQRWNLRNRTMPSEVVPRRQFQNFLYQVFPPAEYAASHPEYYPLVNGKRYIPPADYRYWRPCESNPEVVQRTVEYIRRWFDARPTVDSFSLGMDDIVYVCGCDPCRAMDPHPDSYARRQFSDRHYKFVNAVAREIAKSHPDRYIGTLIYNIARELPETVARLEPNVFGSLTETSGAWWMPGRREADHELTRQWAARVSHLSRYDYYGFASITPRFVPHLMDEQLKFDQRLGLEGMYVEVYTFLPHNAPMIYALAQLQWDTSQSVDALLTEFYARMYGPAAATMQRYYDLLERTYLEPRPGRGVWEHRNLPNQALAMSPEAVDEGLALLQQAAREAATPAERQRLEIVRAALEYGGLAVKTYALSRQLAELKVTNTTEAASALQMVEELGRLGAEREACWAAAPERDDLLGETVRGLGQMGYLVLDQAARLEAGGATAALRLLSWYTAHEPGQLGAVAARLAKVASGEVAPTATAWHWVEQNRPPNLVATGGFEGGPGLPPGWSTWDRTGDAKIGLAAGEGRTGQACSVAGAEVAVVMQHLAVQPGERYLCHVWIRPAAGAGRSGYLAIRYQNANGSWLSGRQGEKSVDMVDSTDWQLLVLRAEVPAEAGRLVLMLGARDQAADDRLLFDDAAVYRLP
ncbi:MAG: DUF4838 domain-containing protein, partial [Armatimonadetes bacterium]|nr:DUF4838 domain-containing protein [Armatimonadota bacterium]